MSAITLYAQSSANYSATNLWNTAADGSGTAYTNPQNGENTFTCITNGKTVTLDVDIAVTAMQIIATGGTWVIPASTARSVTAAISSSYAGPFFTFTSGTSSVTVTGSASYSGSGTDATSMLYNANAAYSTTINGLSTNSGSGYMVRQSAGTVTLNNGTSDAVLNTGSGRAIVTNGGTTGITGNVNNTGSGMGAQLGSTATITGDIKGSNGNPLYLNGGTLALNGNFAQSAGLTVLSAGTLTFNGTFTGTGGEITAYSNLVWSGARSIAAGACGSIRLMSTSVLNLSNLNLSISGVLAISKISTTATITTSSTVITRMITSAQAAISGAAVTVTGPTLPEAANVQSGASQFGYAAALQTPSYPTTAVSKAEQLAVDTNAVTAAKSGMTTTTTILGVSGTIDMSLYGLLSQADTYTLTLPLTSLDATF